MTEEAANIPLQWVGPIKIIGPEVEGEIEVPLATYEMPLWPSTNRGASICRKAGGIRTVLLDDRMTRSVLVEAKDVETAYNASQKLHQRKEEIAAAIRETSGHVRFVDMHHQIVGNLLYIRLEMTTGDASGHNMVTKAADHVLSWICTKYPELAYVSISGNYCTDKKVSAVNGILGRGKSVISDILLPRTLVKKYLKTTPEQIVQLNIKKNLIGSIIAGGVRSANAHFANILLGLYLATGQDASNIIEGSQGFVHTEVRGEDLYFSVSLPNIIVGTVGNGKQLDFVKKNLQKMGCTDCESGANARRLAIITCATVLCGELSLLAAQTIPGELMSAHLSIERPIGASQ
ncbi:MAG: hydroxymethylglutaryl-CoA reductase [Verrucomicrobia bacterium]|nr:hydroxymethylglutaryl-CoA reductase [Verrucomicrobiota bacterium]